MEEFDQYLSGKMDAVERHHFEQKIAANPALQAELKVRKGLRQLHLEAKVVQADTARRAWEHRRNWLRLLLGCTLAGLVGLAVIVWVKKETVPPVPPSSQWPRQIPPAVEPTQPIAKEEVKLILPEKKEAKPGRKLIAEAQTNVKRLPPPDDLPKLRGEEVEAKELKNLIGKVWYAYYPLSDYKLDEVFKEADSLLIGQEYEKAYGKLHRLERKLPNSDTLRLMKGFCLMYMGEGTEALRYFDSVEERTQSIHHLLEWYRGQSLLLSSDPVGAKMIFEKIAADPNHLYQQQGKTALRFLE